MFDPNKTPYGKRAGDNKYNLMTCPFCKAGPIETGENDLPLAFVFRDVLSAKEYYISGLCQDCQDKTFGVGGDEVEVL